MQSLQGQSAGFHFLVGLLKLFRGTNSLISVGISTQILGSKNETVSVPLQTEFTIGRLKIFWCLKLYRFTSRICTSQWWEFVDFWYVLRQNHPLQKVLHKSVVCRCILILDNVRVAYLFYYLMHGYDRSVQGGNN